MGHGQDGTRDGAAHCRADVISAGHGREPELARLGGRAGLGRLRITPLYPFGYGLSDTHFSYSGLRAAPAREGGVDVTFQVTNTGSVTGDEVPQVYLGAPASPPAGVAFADRALGGYDRITLRPGQTQTVLVRIPARQLQYWNTPAGSWVTATGSRPLYVASNERATQLSTTVTTH